MHSDLQANRISKALRKDTEEAYADDQGQLQIGGKFVWKKKIEQDLHSGARARDIYDRERRNTQAEREVNPSPLSLIAAHPILFKTSTQRHL